MFYYRQESAIPGFETGQYLLCDTESTSPYNKKKADEVVASYEELWIIVDIVDGILFKHGSKENIEKIYNEDQEKFRKDNDPVLVGMANNIKMINFSKVGAEEMNMCLEITGYIKKYLDPLIHTLTDKKF